MLHRIVATESGVGMAGSRSASQQCLRGDRSDLRGLTFRLLRAPELAPGVIRLGETRHEAKGIYRSSRPDGLESHSGQPTGYGCSMPSIDCLRGSAHI